MRFLSKVLFVFLLIVCWTAHAQEKSRYMGGDVELVKAPNGAIVNAQVLAVSPKIWIVEQERRTEVIHPSFLFGSTAVWIPGSKNVAARENQNSSAKFTSYETEE